MYTKGQLDWVAAYQVCGSDKSWPHPEGDAGKRGSYKEGRHWALRAVVMEMYKVSQLQTVGCYYFYEKDQGRLYGRGDI